MSRAPDMSGEPRPVRPLVCSHCAARVPEVCQCNPGPALAHLPIAYDALGTVLHGGSAALTEAEISELSAVRVRMLRVMTAVDKRRAEERRAAERGGAQPAEARR